MDRCPVSAIDMDETASVDTLQCIGCGLCVSTCPTGAIDLVVKPDAINPPETMGALDSAMKEG
jgi:Fe-S-cluster-containing hydrogenase component 2